MIQKKRVVHGDKGSIEVQYWNDRGTDVRFTIKDPITRNSVYDVTHSRQLLLIVEFLKNAGEKNETKEFYIGSHRDGPSLYTVTIQNGSITFQTYRITARYNITQVPQLIAALENRDI